MRGKEKRQEKRFNKKIAGKTSGLEDALRKRADIIPAVFDKTGALVLLLDRQGQIVYFNQACERTIGYSLDEVRDRHVWDLFPNLEDRDQVRGTFVKMRDGDLPPEGEDYWPTKDGIRRLVAWSNTALFDKGGSVEYVVYIGFDITERKQAEERLVKSEKKIRMLFEHASLAYQSLDWDRYFIDVNKAWLDLLGFQGGGHRQVVRRVHHPSLSGVFPGELQSS